MNEELKLILKSVKDKTKIEVDVFNEALMPVATTKDTFSTAIPPRADFDEMAADRKNNRIYFRFKFLETPFIGSLTGVGEVEKNYASLIVNLLENVSESDDDLTKEEMLKRIICGFASKRQIIKFTADYEVADRLRYVIAVFSPKGGSENIAEFLSRKLVSDDLVIATDEKTVAVVHSEVDVSNQSPLEFALSLYKDLTKAIASDVVVGVGNPIESFSEIDGSYKQAVSSLKMGNYFFMKTPVFTYADYVLIQMLESMPRFKLSEYLDVLLDADGKALFDDDEMVQTAEAFFENDLNVSEAAREMYMHRNTLMYRLDKIQKATKLNIKNFSDAVTFRLVAIIKKILA